jgi:hypothetical protein
LTDKELAVSIRAFSRRRQFREYLIEFVSGEKTRVRHPEAVMPAAGLWLFQGPHGDRIVFAASSVCRLFDEPG